MKNKYNVKIIYSYRKGIITLQAFVKKQDWEICLYMDVAIGFNNPKEITLNNLIRTGNTIIIHCNSVQLNSFSKIWHKYYATKIKHLCQNMTIK